MTVMGGSVRSLTEVEVDSIPCSPLIHQARFPLGKSMLTPPNLPPVVYMFGNGFQE